MVLVVLVFLVVFVASSRIKSTVPWRFGGIAMGCRAVDDLLGSARSGTACALFALPSHGSFLTPSTAPHPGF